MNSLISANTEPEAGKKPRISKRLKQAIDLWISGTVGTRKAAAERSNLSYEYFCRALKKDHIRSFVRARAEQNISDATLRASSRVLELLDGPSEHVASKVALRLLESDRLIAPAGGQAPMVFNNYGDRPGYAIVLRRKEESEDAELEQVGDGPVFTPRPATIDVTPTDRQSVAHDPRAVADEGKGEDR